MEHPEYDRFVRPHRRAIRQILLDLEFFQEDMGQLNIFSISGRVKDYDSAMRKSRQLKLPVQKLQDIAGIRIVTSTETEVDLVAQFFYRQQGSKDVEINLDQRISRPDGYRARHIVFVYRPRYTRSMFEATVEAQLLTICEHAFNFLSRAWVYKSAESMPTEWQKQFILVSGNLRTVDRTVNQLHAEVVSSANVMADDCTLTPLSYQRIVDSVFKEKISLSDAVDSCRYVVDLGIRTNGALRSFFQNPRIRAMRDQLLTSQAPFAKTWREGAASLSYHGFWLFFGCRLDFIYEQLSKDKL